MNKHIRMFLAAVVLLICSNALAEEWILLDEDQKVSNFYYDKTSTAKKSDGMVTVWARAIYSEQGKADALELMGKPKAYEDLSYTLFMYTINCPGSASRLERVVHYDSKGEKIREFNLSGKTEWEEISPDTRMSLLQEAVCKE